MSIPCHTIGFLDTKETFILQLHKSARLEIVMANSTVPVVVDSSDRTKKIIVTILLSLALMPVLVLLLESVQFI